MQGKNARSSSHVMADTARCVMLAAGQSLMLKAIVSVNAWLHEVAKARRPFPGKDARSSNHR